MLWVRLLHSGSHLVALVGEQGEWILEELTCFLAQLFLLASTFAFEVGALGNGSLL